jgi:hypothetical protein
MPRSANDAQTVRELQWLATLMDRAFRIPGLNIEFGLDAIIGLIPGVGDLVTTMISIYLLAAAGRLGLPRVTLARMGMNVAIDAIVGAVPFFGDMFDVFWKANDKNVSLLQRHLQASPLDARRHARSDWLLVAGMCAILVGLLAGSIALAYMALSWLFGLFV